MKHPADLATQDPIWKSKDEERAFERMEFCYHMWNCSLLYFLDSVAAACEEGPAARNAFEEMSDFLASHFNLGTWKASQMLDVALAIQELPKTRKALLDGDISFEQLKYLVEVLMPQNESDLIAAATGLSVGRTRAMVERIKGVDNESHLDAWRDRMLRTRALTNQMIELHALLPSDYGSAVVGAIEKAALGLPNDPIAEAEGLRTPMDAKRADALYELVMSGACSGGSRGGAEVVVHVQDALLIDGQGVAEIQGGTMLARTSVERLLCDAKLRAVVENSDGEPIGYGRAYRTAPRRMRIDLIHRDKWCAWPGCSSRKLLQSHHIDHWEKDQGKTDFGRMMIFCWYHHHCLHEGGFKVIEGPPTVKIAAPNGSIIANGPPKAPPGMDTLFDIEAADVYERWRARGSPSP